MRRNRKLHRLTEGERGIVAAYVVVCLFGAGLTFIVVNQLGGKSEILRALSAWDIWAILSGIIGSGLGLWLSRRHLGRPGLQGLARAFPGFLMINLAGAVCTGTLALPGYGTMFGPFALIMVLIKNPLILGFWAAVLVGVHLLFGAYRRERESIFPEDSDDGIPEEAVIFRSLQT